MKKSRKPPPMTAERLDVHERLAELKLPKGWVCEKAWPWGNATHFVAPNRRGGVVVQDRRVNIQLLGAGPCARYVAITDGAECYFKGKGWLVRIVAAAKRAVAALDTDFKRAPRLIREQVHNTHVAWIAVDAEELRVESIE